MHGRCCAGAPSIRVTGTASLLAERGAELLGDRGQAFAELLADFLLVCGEWLVAVGPGHVARAVRCAAAGGAVERAYRVRHADD